jgi:hypothetical protein
MMTTIVTEKNDLAVPVRHIEILRAGTAHSNSTYFTQANVSDIRRRFFVTMVGTEPMLHCQ